MSQLKVLRAGGAGAQQTGNAQHQNPFFHHVSISIRWGAGARGVCDESRSRICFRAASITRRRSAYKPGNVLFHFPERAGWRAARRGERGSENSARDFYAPERMVI